MEKIILLGDEALALGAIHAGITAAYSYPGTPASEIMEYLIRNSNENNSFRASWCVNEKVAYEEALGVSFSGKRSIVSMKHVGLNVAADPFMNSAITAINGGLVIAVADDPGMHSSQNEQDSRYYAQFARIFCFEPANHQEAYEMTREAFDLSEKWNIPVMIRMVTRLSHSRSCIYPARKRNENSLNYGKNCDWTLLPVHARRRFKALVERQKELLEFSDNTPFNSLRLNKENKTTGIIASGIAYNYIQENFKELPSPPSILKISTYPVPENLIFKLLNHVETVSVIEEGYPFIEKMLYGLFGMHGKSIKGKISGLLPETGELSPDSVRRALGMNPRGGVELKGFNLPERPPQLCKGCPHADTFNALNRVLESYPQANVFSDIGCYTLAAFPPYEAVNTCVCMGASIGMAKGGSEAGICPSVAIIGDSTFAHSGMTPLLDVASVDTNMTVIILDNKAVAMTGGQPTFATGEELIRIIEGLGVNREHVLSIIPLPKNLEKNVKIIKEEIEHRGLSVIVASRECVQQTHKKKKKRS